MSSPARSAVRVLVTGRVQGVGFRYTCEREARSAGVAGWVRNLAGGGVEVWLEGPPDRVEQLVAWTHHGPPAAVVQYVTVREVEPDGLHGFTIR